MHFVFEHCRDLRHDNIVAFRGMNILECDIEHEKFTLKAGSPFLVMEYIPKNLYRFVEDHKTPESQGLPKSQVWTIGRGIANGLMYLHTLYPPISHRDLKPDNILVRFCSHIICGHLVLFKIYIALSFDLGKSVMHCFVFQPLLELLLVNYR